MIVDFHGKIDEIVLEGGNLRLSGPLVWVGGGPDARSARAITIVAAFAGQSGTPPLVASAFVDVQLPHAPIWQIDLPTEADAWQSTAMAASVLALVTLEDDITQLSRECWNWDGMKR
jgi:hypothetical protein